MRTHLFAALCLLSHAFLPVTTVNGQVSYQQPTARVVRNADGTRLNIKVDPHNQQVVEVLEDANKNIVWRVVKELDDALQPKSATKYDGQNKVVSNHRYLYLRGRVEEEEIMDSKNTFLAKLVFYYDTKGRMTRIEQLNAQGTVVSISRASGLGSGSAATPPSSSALNPSR
jgi:hypothetical protein